MKKSTLFVLVWPFLLGGLILGAIVVLPWLATRPDAYSKGVRATGRLVDVSGGGWLEGPGVNSRDHVRTQFTLEVGAEEMRRFDRDHPEALGGTYSQEGSDYAYFETTGLWCGPLPPEGAMVEVRSTSGYTRGVKITDEAGRVYRSEKDRRQSDCLKHPFVP